MISSVCFLTRLTIRICIMCRYLFSSLTFTQIWPIFGPCLSRSPSSNPSPDSSHSLSSFAFTMLSRFFIRLRNVTRSGAPRQDCHTSNHWCVLYHYHYYYYYYYNKNKWAVSEWVWFFLRCIWIWGLGGAIAEGILRSGGAEGRVLLGLPVLQNVRRWRSNRCVSPFVVFNNPL